MTSTKFILLSGASLLTLTLALPAMAQESQQPIMLDPITIVVDGDDNIEATGGTVLTSEDLEILQPDDVSELFSRESSVTVSGGGGPSKRIHVLGMEQSQLAVTVDGVQQTATSWHHTGSNVIDPAFLKRVEVEAGAAAADAGFAAAAGALRYETVGALDLLEEGETYGGQARLSYGSNGRGVAGSVAAYGRYSGFDWFVMAHGANGDNYDNGDGDEVRGTEPAAANVLAKLGYEFENHRIELGYERSRDDADRLIKMNMGLSGDQIEPLKVKRDTLKLSYRAVEPTDNWDPEIQIYYSQNDYWRPDYLTGGAARTNGNMILKEDLFGGKAQNTFTLDQGTITAGVDFGVHDYHTDNYGNNDRRYRNFDTKQIGTYIQGRFEFDNGFNLSAGARYDGSRFTDWNGERFSDSGASGNATIAYEFNENIEVFAAASRTWLGYVIGDYGYIHARDNAFVTDPDFSTGRAKNYKIGANFGGDNWRGGITYFDTRIEGLPEYGTSELRRTDLEYRSKGVTLNGSYEFANTRIGASYTKADVTVDGEDAIPNSGPFMPVGDTATLYVDHQIPTYNLAFGASVAWAGSIKDEAARIAGFYDQPSYTVVNAYGEWSPSNYEDVSIRLGVDNLFDRTYYERTGFAASENRGGIEPVYAPGRTVTLSTSVKF